MAITLPFPVRVAAGILATGIDRVRSLPEDLPAIPVTLVGNALKLSMKVQQEIATLATRGDELLGGVVNAPQENPSWATFDDDEPVKPVTRITPATVRPTTGRAGAPARPGASGSPAAAPPKAPVNTPPDLIAGPADKPLRTPPATSMPPVTTTATDAAIDVADELVELATVSADDLIPPDPTSGAERIRATEALLDAEEEAGIGAFQGGQVPEEVLDSVVLDDTGELTEGLRVPDGVIADVLAESAADSLLEQEIEQQVELAVAEELLAEAAEIEAIDELVEEIAEAQAADELVGELTVFDTEEALTEAVPDEPLEPVVFGETADLGEGLPINAELIEEVLDDAEDTDAAADGSGEPAALPGYDSMTLAQVRGHLRELTPADVNELLSYEQSGDNRAPFLTLLSNRLVTLDAQNS